MSLRNLIGDDDLIDHSQGPDQWFGIAAQSTRQAYHLRLQSWILRIFTGAGGMPPLRHPERFNLSPLADLLDIPALATMPLNEEKWASQLQRSAAMNLGPLQERGEANWPVSDCAMARNLTWLARSAGLNKAEAAIFEFAVAMRVFKFLQVAVQTWGTLTLADLPHALSAVLHIELESAQAALHAKSNLLNSGTLRLHPEADECLDSLLFVSNRLAQNMANHQDSPEEILSYMVVPLQQPALSQDSFAHMERQTELAGCFIQGVLHAVEAGQTAGHLLVSGSPGLGKTEWARTLLHARDVQALEMVTTARWGSALTGEDRLYHLRMVLHMLRASKRTVILFDEADDVFRHPATPHGHSLGALGRRTKPWRRGAGDEEAVSMDNHRAALNQLMENSRIPVIWIMNYPEVLDPAVRRRFDAEIRFDGLPRSVRLGLIHKRFGLNETSAGHHAEFQRWADIPSLTPALIDRLARMAERARAAGVPMDEALYRHWLRQRIPGRETQHLQSAIHPDFNGTRNDPDAWRPDQVNADVDLMALVGGIQRVGSARLALCGQPGTGKTAFAKALARMLDKPLLEKRASDLLSAYVGETEQRICQAFEDALTDDAVLFIDEVDGLLADRDQAHRNWEVTQVNELLEQLGEYPGVVVVATNRMQAIDPAVQRRIDIQITFDALKPEQVRTGLAALCAAQGIAVSSTELDKAAEMSGVTPGDFAALSRRLRFAPDARTAVAVIALLRELLDHKQPQKHQKHPMGFVPMRMHSPQTIRSSHPTINPQEGESA